MRILHTSDWHLGKTLDNINRIEEQKQFIDELCEIAESESADLVLVAGDIFDTYNPSSAAEELFYDAVDRLNAKGRRAVVVIAGNHDSPDRLCAASPLAYKNGIVLLGYPGSDAGIFKNSSILQAGPGWLEIKPGSSEHSAVIIALPYPSESRLEQLISADSSEDKLQEAYSEKICELLHNLSKNFREDTVNLIVSHLYLRDGRTSDSERQLGGALVVDPCRLPDNAHFIALGHLHRPQRVKSAPSPTYYSGSPLAYSFSETDYSKVVYIVDAVPGRESEIREVYLKSGKPLKQWKARNGIMEALGWCEEGKDLNAWIDLEIYTDRALTLEEQKLLRELNPGIINIRPVITDEKESIISFENREGKKIEELFKDYYRYKTGMEAAEEMLETFLEVINEIQPGGEENEAQVS
ncbi:MAG: exonuclease SbcCD subunit D [Gracilibacteraceae bacterium]|jgi:exonuclease SbcD|nr:exonuclease SbcCD subunit D [Gracilibacteraceae bacterium]